MCTHEHRVRFLFCGRRPASYQSCGARRRFLFYSASFHVVALHINIANWLDSPELNSSKNDTVLNEGDFLPDLKTLNLLCWKSKAILIFFPKRLFFFLDKIILIVCLVRIIYSPLFCIVRSSKHLELLNLPKLEIHEIVLK